LSFNLKDLSLDMAQHLSVEIFEIDKIHLENKIQQNSIPDTP